MPPELDTIAQMIIADPVVKDATNEADNEEPVEENDYVQEESEQSSESEARNEEVEQEEVTEEAEPEIEVDELEVDVNIDGEVKAVKLKDLKSRYAGEGAIEKRLEEATKARQAMYAYTADLHKVLEVQMTKLQQLDEILEKSVQPDINWEELRAKDPGRYLLERDRFNENERRREALAHQRNTLKAQQDYLTAQANAEKAREETQILIQKLPILKNQETVKQVLSDFVTVGQEYGYSQKEIDSVNDHRAMMVLYDAIQYRKLMAEKASKEKEPKPAPQQLRQLVRPNGKTTNSSSADKNRRIQQALTARAKATGKPDDVAALLIVDRKKK